MHALGRRERGLGRWGVNAETSFRYIFLVMIIPYTHFTPPVFSTVSLTSSLASCPPYLIHTSVCVPSVILNILNRISDSPLYWVSNCFSLFVLFLFGWLGGWFVLFYDQYPIPLFPVVLPWFSFGESSTHSIWFGWGSPFSTLWRWILDWGLASLCIIFLWS